MKTYAILVTLIVVGLGLMLLSSVDSKAWLSQLASVLVIGGCVGVLDKVLLRQEEFERTRELFNLHETAVHLGMCAVHLDANSYSLSHMIRTHNRLSIILNDGRTWFLARIVDFQHRFKQAGFETEFFLVAPDGAFVSVLAEKTGYSREEQIGKIKEAKARIQEEFAAHKSTSSRLRIYHMPYFPTHSAFLGSELAVVCHYGISSGRRPVPLFVFKKTDSKPSLFADVEDDVARLRHESTLAFDSAAQSDRREQVDPTARGSAAPSATTAANPGSSPPSA